MWNKVTSYLATCPMSEWKHRRRGRTSPVARVSRDDLENRRLPPKVPLRRWTRWTSFSKWKFHEVSAFWWEICIENETNVLQMLNMSVLGSQSKCVPDGILCQTEEQGYTAGNSQSKRMTGSADWRTNEATYWVFPHFWDLFWCDIGCATMYFLLSLYCGRLTLS